MIRECQNGLFHTNTAYLGPLNFSNFIFELHSVEYLNINSFSIGNISGYFKIKSLFHQCVNSIRLISLMMHCIS